MARGLIPRAVYQTFGIYCVDTIDRVWALTYDDGPDPASTPRVLDVLRRHRAVATFFVLSGAAERHPEIVRRIVDEGHELALHGVDHQPLLTLTTKAAITRIRASRDILEQLTGRRVTLYRPPHGDVTPAQKRAIYRLGLRVVIWSGHASDWIDAPEVEVAERAVRAIFPGSVQLMHDARADPANLEPGELLPTFDRGEVLERILAQTRAAGYRELAASELFARYPIVQSMSRVRMGPT
ncbi:MAG TPA: polysaccharide deacetylase family protein [Microbacteriaceae bacterium]